jgi:molybdopterin converting factor small subunit
MKKIQLNYYALFRQQAGRSEEIRETSAKNCAELYAEVAQAFSFELPASMVQVSINDSYVPWDSQIKEGDKVTFIPPVAGG